MIWRMHFLRGGISDSYSIFILGRRLFIIPPDSYHDGSRIYNLSEIREGMDREDPDRFEYVFMFFLLLVQKKERNPPERTVRYGRGKAHRQRYTAVAGRPD